MILPLQPLQVMWCILHIGT